MEFMTIELNTMTTHMNEGMKIHSQLAISRCKALDTEPCHIWDTVVSPRRIGYGSGPELFYPGQNQK
jgi:hypothetical protein